ncbi:bub2 protein [Phlyctochytrium arcticum]|nr:bub2 protein [Phlyctochytrium arcticum]
MHGIPQRLYIRSALPSHRQYEKILGGQYKTDSAMRNALHSLRTLVLKKGIQEDYEVRLRGRIWKVLLGIYRVSSSEYLGLIDRGPSDVYEKIRNDTFRTLATDKKFLAIVDEEMLSRLLNAFVWKMKGYLPRSRLLNYCFTYVQGMNVMVAPFLYVMPELDAFYTFSAFLQSSCPLYVQPALEGVHCGLKLVDRCLRLCDPSLHRYLLSKKLNATLYAFPAVMTFSACTPPLEEVIQLWDFFVAYGFHLNVLCVTGQIILMRDQLLSHESPMRLLRKFPPLDAKKLIKIARSLVFKLPEDIYDLLARHPFDAGVYDIIMGLDDQRINSQEIWMGD